jgi:beta-lactamase regulating signal transducer with metallopeptidase domain
LGRKFAALLFVVLVGVFSILSVPVGFCVPVTGADAASAIAAARGELVVCYLAVANASSAGANVTGLILVLDQARGNLSRADLAYKMGNYSVAQSYANQSLDLLVQNNVEAQAASLTNQALGADFWDFMINVVCSLVGAVAVIVVGFVLWVVLKKRYTDSEGSAK